MKKLLLTYLIFVFTRYDISAQTIGNEVLSYHNGCVYPENFTGINIDTKIPFDQSIMHTIIIEGYAYGTAENIDLKINFYLFDPGSGMYIYNPVVSTSGAYQPKIKLVNKNGFITIYLEKGSKSQYCINFKVRAWQIQSSQPSWYQNWTAGLASSDPSVGLPTKFVGECVYKNNFSGNVGIGTDSPNGLLNLFKENFLSRTSATDLLYLSSNHSSVGFNGFGTSIVDFRRTYQNATPHAINRISFLERGDSINDWGGAITFSTKGLSSGAVEPTEKMRIDYNGNIGIGTFTPDRKLVVNGEIAFDYGDNKSYNGVKRNYVATEYFNIITSSPTNVIHRFSGSAGVDKLVITEGGNVGIGINTPVYKLDLNGVLRVNNEEFGSSTVESGFKIKVKDYGGIANDAGIGIHNDVGAMWFNNVAGGGYYFNNGTAGEMFRLSGNGNVGIGTNNPIEKLTIYGENNSKPGILLLQSSREDIANAQVGSIKAMNGNGEIARIDLNREGGSSTGYISFFTKAINSTPVFEAMRIGANGNIGIGTIAPSQKLHVAGYGQFDNGIIGNSAGLLLLGSPSSPLSNGVFLTQNGALGIGVQNGTFPSGYKLAVDGNIIAEKVKVKNSNAWPDYVFRKEYKLQTLSEIEKYVNENSHLPEIPSASEIEKEGHDLGEMNRLLLKKVEELTLYLIEQNKEMKIKTAQIRSIETQLNELKQAVNK